MKSEITMKPLANAYIALGSNLEEPLKQLQMAYQALSQAVELIQVSSIYKTAPVGEPAEGSC